MVLNTSFNGRGQPLVETPHEALAGARAMDLDACVVDERFLRR
jgi:predicted NodU family carbamoyl transferase